MNLYVLGIDLDDITKIGEIHRERARIKNKL